MASCWTISPKSGAVAGIRVVRLRKPDGAWGAPHVIVGEEGRGRKLVRVPLPPGAKVDWLSGYEDHPQWVGTLRSVPGDGVILLILDHSGYRGGWSLTRPDDSVIIAEGWCAQGIAGRMGGGPEVLLRVPLGSKLTIARRGRLYGAPAYLIVDAVAEDRVVIHDADAERESEAAAARWGESA